MSSLVYKIITEVYTPPPGFSYGSTWESIVFPEGYEKPPKEEFEAKLQELIDAQPLKELRQERNKRLAEVDWVFSADYQIEDEKRSEWLAYRQALRDLPSTTGDPANPTWPEKPSTPTGTTLDVNLENLKNISIPQNAQITLLQNAVHELTSRIEALENA